MGARKGDGTNIAYASRPEHPDADMLPMKYHENLLLVSPFLYQRPIV